MLKLEHINHSFYIPYSEIQHQDPIISELTDIYNRDGLLKIDVNIKNNTKYGMLNAEIFDRVKSTYDYNMDFCLGRPESKKSAKKAEKIRLKHLRVKQDIMREVKLEYEMRIINDVQFTFTERWENYLMRKTRKKSKNRKR